jgi:RNA polymerase sigma-70 factor (ECF subfamily)
MSNPIEIMSESEATLVQQAQKGDHDAFAALVNEHQRYVYNLALRVVKDENEALDLAQETFVRAWTALPNFKGKSQFRTWLYRIVTNLCYNRLPNLRRSLNDLGDDVMEDIPEPGFVSPAKEFEFNETRRHLQEAMEALDDQYRLLLTMRYQNELSYEEIASTLNLPLGTVKTGIFRAKAQLRNALANLEDSWIAA